MMKTNSSMIGSRVSLLDGFGRQPSKSTVLKPTANRRVVNPNFLFFCQVVLLVVPIAVLYAGLYFLDVSSRTIVIVCGVGIFAFLIVAICVRPFTTPEAKGDDTVPLTQDMSPSGQHRYSSGILSEEKLHTPFRSQESAKSRSLPRRESVQDAMIEACSCPHNPTPQETDQFQSDGGEQSDNSNSSLLSDKKSSAGSEVSDSSEEPPKKDSWPPVCAIGSMNKRTDSELEKASTSSNINRKPEDKSCLEDSQNSDHNGKKQGVARFDMRESKTNDPPLQASSSQTPKSSTVKVTDRAGAARPVKQRSEVRIGPCSTSTAKRVLFNGSDDEPLAKQTRDHEKKTPTCKFNPTCTLHPPKTPELGSCHAAGDGLPQSEKLPALRFPSFSEKNQFPEVTIRLYPKSSKEGVFEWVPSNRSPSCSHKTGTFNTVVYNMHAIEAAEGSVSVTLNESSHNMLPLNTDAVHQMMVSSLEEKAKVFQDFGTQVEMPEMIPKPPSVVHVINEKVPSRANTSSKAQKSEPIQHELMQPSKDSVHTTKLIVEKIETIDQSCQSMQRGTVSVCNDSILDFVMRRPFSGKSESPANYEEHGSLKTSGTPLLENKVNVGITDDEKPKDTGMTNRVTIDSATPASGSSSTTPSRWSSCDSRGLLKCNLPYLQPKDETWKIKGNDREKICSPKEESKVLVDNLSAEQSKAFFTSLYMGSKDMKYQPKKLGLLATESSKEEMISGKRKTGHSPKTKKKNKTRHDEYHTDDGQVDGEIALRKYTPQFERNDREKRSPVLTPKKHGCTSANCSERSPIRNQQFPTRSQQSYSGFNKSPIEYHQSSTNKPISSRRKQLSPLRNEKSPVRNMQSPTRHQQSSSTYNKSPIRCSQSPTSNQVSAGSKQCSHLRNEISPIRNPQSPTRHQQSSSTYNKSPIRCHQSPTRNQMSAGRKQCSPLRNEQSPSFHEWSRVRSPQSPTRCQQSTSRSGRSPTKYHQPPTKKPVSTTREEHSPLRKHDISRTSSSTPQIQKEGKNGYNKMQAKGHLADPKGRRFSFPPFNLDFSNGLNNNDGNQASSDSWTNGQQGHLDRKRRPATGDKKKRRDDKSLLTSPGKCKSPDESPTGNKNRRISHRVESTLFKKSSSSYDNVIIERVLKQKKKTLKKFKESIERRITRYLCKRGNVFCGCHHDVPSRSCTCGLHQNRIAREPVVSAEPMWYSPKPAVPPEQPKIEKPKPVPEKPPKIEKPKPVPTKKVAAHDNDRRQQSCAPILSLHRKDVLNKGKTFRRRSDANVTERRRSSWEFFLESKRLKRLKKKQQEEKKEEKINRDWKDASVNRVGRKSIKRTYMKLRNSSGFGNKKLQMTKKKGELYPLNEFNTRSSKPIRMNVQ